MASSSSSSFASPKWNYDVFLSFRGEDTRRNFVDHLYEALNQKGIYTFKDDEVLERGKSISPELLKAIEESRFAIVIFSTNYCCSSWCLDELLKIVECRDQKCQTVVPVFYDVEPSEVRKQSGIFGEAFKKHEVVYSEKVKKWREALVEVANISGWDVPNTANGHESKCIQQLVGEILSELGHTVSGYMENLVGIVSRVEDMNFLLGGGSNAVHIIGIWGMGGIGKTTIAKAYVDKIGNEFEGVCFLSEVRANSKKYGLEHLQEKLLFEILMLTDITVRSVHEGTNMIRNRLRYKKVLVVLDDVDHLDQLDALAGKHAWFGIGSIIIVTTRNKHLLLRHGVDKIYEVDVLNDKEAIQLFSWNAFKKSHPTKEYKELSYRVVNYAGGLPLALKVLGSFLCCRSMEEWRSTLDRLEEIPENEILEQLKISFDGLKDVEKKIFLDIACFFNGEQEDSVKRILDSFGFHPIIGISVLVEKSLLVISNDMLQMHHLIQELGWLIVRQVDPTMPGRHSRLWLPEDVCHVLTENEGTEAVEGIALELPKPKDVNISNEAFKQINRLRLLKVHNACFSRGIEYLPNELRWLDWHGYPSKFLPSSFQASKLVGLVMCYSRIVQLWKGGKLLDKLKFINLSHSQKLTRTPDVTGVPNLERLDLEDCTSLVEIHPSIAVHKKIIFLNFRDCKYLKSLPNGILLESLEIFILSGCVKLNKFPEILGSMERLSKLYLDETAIKGLPSSIDRMKRLILIDMTNCTNLTSLPNSICSLSSLKFLTLSGCAKLDKLPENLGIIECLEELRGDRTAIRQPPSSIVLLKNLKVLSFSGCKGATSHSWSSLFLSQLFPGKYENSVSMVLPSVKGLYSLIKLDLSDCSLLDGGIPDDLGYLSSLKELNLSRNNFVNVPPSISRLPQLEILELVCCKRLEALPQLPSSISELYADDCVSLEGMGDLFPKYEKLRTVSLTNCFNVVDNMGDILWQWLVHFISTNLLQLAASYQYMLHPSYSPGLQKYDIDQNFSILIPGTEIPDCFKDQGMGSKISVRLPPQWYNNRFMGFAICVVSESISANNGHLSYYLQNIPTIGIEMSLRTLDGNGHHHFTMIGRIGTNKNVDLKHVFLGYLGFDSIWMSCYESIKSPNMICKIKAAFRHIMTEYIVIKEWGFRRVYVEDVKQEDQKMLIQSLSRLRKFSLPREYVRSLEVDDFTSKRRRDDIDGNNAETSGSGYSDDDEIYVNKRQCK